MHPIGQILHYDKKREFEGRRVKHPHVVIYLMDVPKTDKNLDDEVISFIVKYITCSLPDKDRYSELNYLGKVQTHHHRTICRKRKGFTCRFNARCSFLYN